MIKYKTVLKKYRQIEEVHCNHCGDPIINDVVRKDFLHVDKQWGYESNKDFEQHSFDLCEKCYDELIHSFKIPVKIQKY